MFNNVTPNTMVIRGIKYDITKLIEDGLINSNNYELNLTILKDGLEEIGYSFKTNEFDYDLYEFEEIGDVILDALESLLYVEYDREYTEDDILDVIRLIRANLCL